MHEIREQTAETQSRTFKAKSTFNCADTTVSPNQPKPERKVETNCKLKSLHWVVEASTGTYLECNSQNRNVECLMIVKEEKFFEIHIIMKESVFISKTLIGSSLIRGA